VEVVGIALALIAGLVAAPIFFLVLVKVIRPYPSFVAFVFWAAASLLGLFSVEIALVLFMGVLSTRALIGPSFFLVHVLLTFGAAPALARVLLLGRRSIKGWWPLVAALCWFVGAAAIFYQYYSRGALRYRWSRWPVSVALVRSANNRFERSRVSSSVGQGGSR
jgi:hypothetical protein